MDHTHLERERPYLFGLAYRLLGSAADADDVLQEAFLRVRSLDEARSPRGLLTTVVTRLCLDEVRSARRRHEEYVGPWLPEPIATSAPSPDGRFEESESISMAFLVLLESLSPLERAVFVLREVLDLDFAEVADAVGRSEAACRQLLHRAREHVAAGRKRTSADPQELRTLTSAFLGALGSGDLDQLTQLLTADVTAVADHGGKAKSITREVVGADRVGRLLAGLFGKAPEHGRSVEFAWINGRPGVLGIFEGQVESAYLIDVVVTGSGPRVQALRIIRNPDKLVGLNRARDAGRLEGLFAAASEIGAPQRV